jgi:transporter family protein
VSGVNHKRGAIIEPGQGWTTTRDLVGVKAVAGVSADRFASGGRSGSMEAIAADPMESLPRVWLVWAVLAAVFAAITSVLAKLGLEGIGSNLATWLRTLVVVALLTPLLLATGELQGLSALPKRSLLFLLLSGAATSVSWLCYFRALQLGPVSRVAPIDKLSVVLVAVLGVWVLGEQLGARQWLAVLLMGAGAVLLAWPGG